MRNTRIQFHNKQTGVALLTALLVVSMAAIIAVNITERQQYDIRRMQNLLFNQQAFYYATGGEAWAQGLLYKDHQSDQKNNGTDNLYEDWAQPLPLTLIENGSILGEITDLQGLFNINNLYIDDRTDPTQLTRLSQQKQLFDRLLTTLEINTSITPAIIDWLDKDTDSTFPDGAEDDVYLQMTPAYRTANRRMDNPSELMLIAGINTEIYNKLKPFISALPEATTININTAPAEVIAALSSQLDIDEATNIVKDRTSAFDSIQDFLRNTQGYAQNINNYQGNVTPLINVTTRYFKVTAEVKIDNINKQLISILKRNTDSSVNIISRSPGDN